MVTELALTPLTVLAFAGTDYIIWKRTRITSIRRILKTISVDGRQWTYTETGRGEPILFVYGGGSGPDSIQQFDWLAQAGYRLISVNRPGYLEMSIPSGTTFESQADSYADLLNVLGVSKVHVFGVSMGGPTALYFAERHRGKTQSLVLWSAVTGNYAPDPGSLDTLISKAVLHPRFKGVMSWLLARAAVLFPAQVMASFLRATADLESDAKARLIRQELSGPSQRREFCHFINSLTPMSMRFDGMMLEIELAARDWSCPLHHYKGPLFSAHSSIDIDVPIDHQNRLREKRPDGQFMTVKAGGHFCFWGVEGQLVRNGTLSFLRDVPVRTTI